MFHVINVELDFIGPRIPKPNKVVLVGADLHACSDAEPTVALATFPTTEASPTSPSAGQTRHKSAKFEFPNDVDLSRVVLSLPDGSAREGHFQFSSKTVAILHKTTASGTQAVPGGGVTYAVEGDLDAARKSLVRTLCFTIRRQGEFAVTMFPHQDLPPDIPLKKDLTLEQAMDTQNENGVYFDACVTSNTLFLTQFDTVEDKPLKEYIYMFLPSTV